MEDDMECEICLQTETDFYIVCEYKHSFCWYCSERLAGTCPKCRQPLSQPQQDHLRNHLIQRFLYEFYTNLKQDPQQDVDALDCDGKWYRAKIISHNKKFFRIHYYGWGDNWDEWIFCGSGRIMPANTHTEDWVADITIGKAVEFLLTTNNMRRWHAGTVAKILPFEKKIMVVSTLTRKNFKINMDMDHLTPMGTHTPLT